MPVKIRTEGLLFMDAAMGKQSFTIRNFALSAAENYHFRDATKMANEKGA